MALDSPALLEVVVKPLDLDGGQLVQRDVPNSGDDVVLDVVGVVGFGVGPDAGLGVDPRTTSAPMTQQYSCQLWIRPAADFR